MLTFRLNLILSLFISLPLIVGSLPACKTTPKAKTKQGPMETGQPALHAVHDQRLRDIMKSLKRLTFDRLPQEMDIQRTKRGQIEEISGVAQKIAVAAEKIPIALKEGGLNEEERKVFLRLADKLRRQALELKKLAEKGTLREMTETIDKMTETCNACHSALRLPSGALAK